MSSKGLDLIKEADRHWQHGHYKDAHIKYGRAVAEDLPDGLGSYCRHMRGVCSRLIAQQRMQLADQEPGLRKWYLDEAARWLAKSEANLDSAAETAGKVELAKILWEHADTELAIIKFMQMCGSHDTSRRLENENRFRTQALALR